MDVVETKLNPFVRHYVWTFTAIGLTVAVLGFALAFSSFLCGATGPDCSCDASGCFVIHENGYYLLLGFLMLLGGLALAVLARTARMLRFMMNFGYRE